VPRTEFQRHSELIALVAARRLCRRARGGDFEVLTAAFFVTDIRTRRSFPRTLVP
jgi:hypothetical protein